MITIYCSVNSTAPCLHWWLCNDKRFGPQAYYIPDQQPNGKHIGSLVLEDRDDIHVPIDVYHQHQKTHQNMENLRPNGTFIDFTQPFEKYNDKYKHVVWSNYFGSIYQSSWKIQSDYSIIIDSTIEDFIFNYVSVYAFIPLDVAKSERDSRIWYEDHTILDNEFVNEWKTLWYEKYHPQVLQQFEDGKLKYMWQLNYAHWDLHHAIIDGKDKIDLDFSEHRLFDKFKDDEEIIFNKDVIKTNTDSLIINTDWHNNTSQILEYIGESSSPELEESLKVYSNKYEANRKLFYDLFGKHL